jgi:hypothetical protein
MDKSNEGQTPVVEQEVTPWAVKADQGIDYTKLINHFGTLPITKEDIARLERVTGQPAHPWLKRGLFFSHRYSSTCSVCLREVVYTLQIINDFTCLSQTTVLQC